MSEGVNSQSMHRDPRAVFVVHGRDTHTRDALFAFLRALDLKPLEWDPLAEKTGANSYIGDILRTGFSQAQAIIVLMTPDDEARLREPLRRPGDQWYELELTPQPRPNVIFEAGMALALHPERTVLVEVGRLRPFTDILGRYVIALDNDGKTRNKLVQQLVSAGCPVDLKSGSWLTAGDFTLVTPPPMSAEVLQEIMFDYADDPTQHGWRVYESTPVFKHTEDGYCGRALEIQRVEQYALDFVVDEHGQAAQRLEYTARYIDSACLYARIGLRTADGSQGKTGWLAFAPGTADPQPFGEGTWEWTVELMPREKLGPWSVFSTDLAEATARSFGVQGWVYDGLRGFRIRGTLGIKRIRLLA